MSEKEKCTKDVNLKKKTSLISRCLSRVPKRKCDTSAVANEYQRKNGKKGK